ncbi:MliC family protein [Pontivivens nitratireducens]|uniref:MliC family protein n=1 Tax=Pontivivens nitratireducens TaxID=2758038 RepID=UPI00163A2EDB|nr:MliC family protein [Pontibrevibacter nitratireducens]
MIRTTLLALTVAVPAQAEISLSLPLGAQTETIVVHHTCADGRDLSVRYITDAHQSLALLSPDGSERLFVAVLAGSGVRYVSGEWEWWNKGNEGTLTNLRTRMAPLLCEANED